MESCYDSLHDSFLLPRDHMPLLFHKTVTSGRKTLYTYASIRFYKHSDIKPRRIIYCFPLRFLIRCINYMDLKPKSMYYTISILYIIWMKISKSDNQLSKLMT